MQSPFWVLCYIALLKIPCLPTALKCKRPGMNDVFTLHPVETDADLALATEAVSRKMSPVTCATPLQELALVTPTPLPWPEDRLPVGKKAVLSTTVMAALTQPDLSNGTSYSARLLSHVAVCFVNRFRKRANVCYQPHCIAFSIR